MSKSATRKAAQSENRPQTRTGHLSASASSRGVTASRRKRLSRSAKPLSAGDTGGSLDSNKSLNPLDTDSHDEPVTRPHDAKKSVVRSNGDSRAMRLSVERGSCGIRSVTSSSNTVRVNKKRSTSAGAQVERGKATGGSNKHVDAPTDTSDSSASDIRPNRNTVKSTHDQVDANANLNAEEETAGQLPSFFGRSTSNPVIEGVDVDRLAFTFDIDKPVDAKEIAGRFADFRKSIDGHVSVRRLSSTLRAYQYSYEVLKPNGEQLGLIEFAPVKRNMNFVRVDCNPAKIGKRGVAEILRVIRGTFGPKYKEHIASGNFTRLDFAVDVGKLAACDVLMFSARSRSQSLWSRSVNQDGRAVWNTETVCLGAPTSDYVAKLYDKAVQMWKVKGIELDELRTRIEVSIAPRYGDGKSIRVMDVSAVRNPFAALNVIYFPAPEDSDPWFEFFVHAAHRIGAEEALRRIKNKTKRAAYRSKLADHSPDWWKPERIWDRLKRRLGLIGLYLTADDK